MRTRRPPFSRALSAAVIGHLGPAVRRKCSGLARPEVRNYRRGSRASSSRQSRKPDAGRVARVTRHPGTVLDPKAPAVGGAVNRQRYRTRRLDVFGAATSGVAAHDEPLADGRDRSAAAFGDDGFGHAVELYGDDRLVTACQQDGTPVGRPNREVAGRNVDVVAASRLRMATNGSSLRCVTYAMPLPSGDHSGQAKSPSASSSATPVRTYVHHRSPKRIPSVRVRMNAILSCSGDQLWPRTSPKPWVSACSVARFPGQEVEGHTTYWCSRVFGGVNRTRYSDDC